LQSESKSRAEKVRKGVALVSGGADSMLALRLVQKQGIEMLAINFCSCFFGCRKPGVGKPGTGLQKACESFGVPLWNIMLGDEYLRMLADPKHGYGKASNPCVDCHILMLQKAREVMIDEGASFVVTGEIPDVAAHAGAAQRREGVGFERTAAAPAQRQASTSHLR